MRNIPGIDPLVLSYLQDKSKDPNKVKELLAERRAEKESGLAQQAQQGFISSLSEAASGLGAIGGKTARSNVQMPSVDTDTRGLDLAIASESRKPTNEELIKNYLIKNTGKSQEKGLSAKEKADLEFKRQKFEYEKEQDKLNRLEKQESLKNKASKPAKLSESESKTAMFYKRADQAEKILSEIESDPELYDPSTYGRYAAGKFGEVGENIYDLFNKDEAEPRRRYDQAKRAFINAILRKESGAVISPSEFESKDLELFPQLNDPPSVIQQKALQRRQEIESLKMGSGAAGYEPSNEIGMQKPATPLVGGGSQMVDIIRPDGTPASIPRETWDQYKNEMMAEGYKEE